MEAVKAILPIGVQVVAEAGVDAWAAHKVAPLLQSNLQNFLSAFFPQLAFRSAVVKSVSILGTAIITDATWEFVKELPIFS